MGNILETGPSELVILVFLLLQFSQADKKSLCQRCEKLAPTMLCKFCVLPCVSKPLDLSEGNFITKLHNTLRNNVALGRTRLPTASNMGLLEWGVDTAATAQRWADKCHAMLMGSEVHTSQNYADYVTSVASSRFDILERIFKMWADEIYNFNVSHIRSYNPKNEDNITQILWGNRLYVGCGRVEIPASKEKLKRVRVFCNYGSLDRQPRSVIYREGKPRSKCLVSYLPPNIIYPGLCRNGDRIIESDYLGNTSFVSPVNKTFEIKNDRKINGKCGYTCAIMKLGLFIVIGGICVVFMIICMCICRNRKRLEAESMHTFIYEKGY